MSPHGSFVRWLRVVNTLAFLEGFIVLGCGLDDQLIIDLHVCCACCSQAALCCAPTGETALLILGPLQPNHGDYCIVGSGELVVVDLSYVMVEARRTRLYPASPDRIPWE